jgi:hypothetical protein
MTTARGEAAACAAFAAALAVLTSWFGARDSALPIGALGAYFDGHLYLEIARSFPLPYGPGAVDYAGHAPGYPFAAWLLRVLLPNAWLDWGGLLILVSWICAAVSTALFHAVCRELGAPTLWPTLLFAVGNPRMLTLTGTASSDPLAMTLALAGLLALLRGHAGWCIAWIALAGFARFAAFTLLAPVALGLLLQRRLTSPGHSRRSSRASTRRSGRRRTRASRSPTPRWSSTWARSRRGSGCRCAARAPRRGC